MLNFLLLSIFIARFLGDVILGRYSFVQAFTSIFAVFLTFGFDTIIIRDVARDKALAPKYLGNIAVIRIILSLVVFGSMVLIINLMHYPSDTSRAVLIFGAYVICQAFASMFKAIPHAFERMEYGALASTTGRLVTASLGLLVLFLGYGLIEVAYAFLIGAVCNLVLSVFICTRRFARPRFELDFKFWLNVARAAIPIGFLSITTMIFVRIDSVMLSAMKGDAVVGWYNAAYNIVLGLKPIPHILVVTILPVTSRFFLSSPGSLRFTYEKLLYYLFILGLPLAVGTMLLADHIIILLYGEPFRQSVAALQVLAWDILLYFVYSGLGMLLISINRQNCMALSTGICAVVNVILNLVLIPPLNYIGAGIATIATEAILLGLYFYFATKYLHRLPFSRIVPKPVIASCIMALFVYLCRSLNLFVLVISAMVVYFASFFLIRGVSGEDIALLNQLVKIPEPVMKWISRVIPRSKD